MQVHLWLTKPLAWVHLQLSYDMVQVYQYQDIDREPAKSVAFQLHDPDFAIF